MSIIMKLPKVPDFKITPVKANEAAGSIKIDIVDKDFNLVFKNLQAVATLTKFAVARAIASIAIDLLADSQPRVPYYDGGGEISLAGGLGKASTGKLRLSGRAVMQYGRGYKDVAWGRMDGGINYDISLVTRAATRNATKFGAVVFYSRNYDSDSMTSPWGISASEDNLAEWLHQNLQPHQARSIKKRGDGMYYARTPGTGPKFLEIPFIQKKQSYIEHLYKVVNRVEKVIPLISKFDTSKGLHRADRVELIQDKIDDMGFFFSYNGK